MTVLLIALAALISLLLGGGVFPTRSRSFV